MPAAARLYRLPGAERTKIWQIGLCASYALSTRQGKDGGAVLPASAAGGTATTVARL